MNIVDSSGWLEYFASGPNAEKFSAPIQQAHQLLVPSLILTEVFKRILQQRDEAEALRAVAHMIQAQVVDLNAELAIEAGRIGYQWKIPLADSIILATCLRYQATLWTQDEDFKNLPGVQFIPK